MGALDVLPLVAAKRYLNIKNDEWDDELEQDFIPPAVERVERHIAGQAGVGVTLTAAADATATQILAVKMVLGEYWRTQRTAAGRGGFGGTSAAQVDADTGPAGTASLRSRLTDMLGPPADSDDLDGPVPSPTGAFPPAQRWPDPPPRYAGRWC